MIIERSLIHYIARAQEIGFSREKIEWSLFEVGWPLRTVKRAYHITRMIHGLRTLGSAILSIGHGLTREIANYRVYIRRAYEILGAYILFLRDGVRNTLTETRMWFGNIKTRLKTRRERIIDHTPKTAVSHTKKIPAFAIKNTPPSALPTTTQLPQHIKAHPFAKASEYTHPKEPTLSKVEEYFHVLGQNTTKNMRAAPKGHFHFLWRNTAKKIGAQSLRFHYPQFSFFTTLSSYWSRVINYGTDVFEHSIKERFNTSQQEVLGFLGFLVSNTVRGLEEFIYDIIHILIVVPFLFLKSLVIRITPHTLPARSSATGRARHIPRGFEYHGVSLPGHIRGIDIIELSSRMFRTRRMRTFLTVLGISIGIGTILFLVSLGYGLQNIIFERIATTESLLTLDVTAGEKEIISLDRGAILKITALPGVMEVSPLASISGQVSINELSANTEIRGINPSYFNLGGIRTSAGRIFEETERDKAVISLAVMRLFNITNPEDIIGKQAEFNLLFTSEEIGNIEVTRLTTAYEIVGIIDDTETSFVYLPLASLEQFNISTFSQVKLKMATEQNAEAIRGEIISMGFFVSAVSDILDQATKIFRAIQIVLAIFGLVALIVSAIGMFNTMTIALLERTQEIGIMKALGATPRDIWFMFLSESVIMGFLGGIGGILTGIIGAEIFNIGIGLLANAVGASSTDLFQRPLWFIITIAVFSTLIGFITGLWPAHRASKLNTLAALRYK